MTSQEARKQVDNCEIQINEGFNNLRQAARSMGRDTVKSSSSRTVRNTLLPLIVSLIGIALCFFQEYFWGVVLILTGIAIAYGLHQNAKNAENAIVAQNNTLNKVLDSNSNI